MKYQSTDLKYFSEAMKVHNKLTIIMPTHFIPSAPSTEIIEQAIKRVWDKIGIKTFTDMDTLGGNKFCDICLNIRTSNYFIAAINTTQCPSVYHELGMAQALGREVIIIVSKSFLDENEKTFPWNIQVFKPVIYDDDTTKMPMTLEIELCEWIKQHMTGIDMSLINNYQQEQNRLLNRP